MNTDNRTDEERLEDEQFEQRWSIYVAEVIQPIIDREDLHVGDIYEHCSYQPVRCTELDVDSDTISGVSLVTGAEGYCCSIANCGIRKMTDEEAQEVVNLWKTGGERAILIRNGHTEESADLFIKEWRS